MPDSVAYLDESFHEHDHTGFYVLAAAVFERDHEPARDAMRVLRGRRRTAKLHWNEMDEQDRQVATSSVAALDGAHLVAVGAPVPPRGQERARRIVLRRLVAELHAVGVTELQAESRGPDLDRRDVQLVQAARYDLPKGTRVYIEHVRGGAEPLLWVADIVAGAVRLGRQGRTEYAEVLGSRLRVIKVDC